MWVIHYGILICGLPISILVVDVNHLYCPRKQSF